MVNGKGFFIEVDSGLANNRAKNDPKVPNRMVAVAKPKSGWREPVTFPGRLQASDVSGTSAGW